jgi:hypothetical protein
MLYVCARTICVPRTSMERIVQRFNIQPFYVHGFQMLVSQHTENNDKRFETTHKFLDYLRD